MKTLLTSLMYLMLPLLASAQFFNIAAGRSSNDGLDYVTASCESNGGYVFQGISTSASNGLNGDMAIVRTNFAGAILWQKNYEIGSESQYGSGGSMATLSDGTCCVVGQTTYYGGFIFRIDAAGNVMWLQKFTDGVNSAFFKCVTKTSDGNFIACGRFENQGLVVKFTPTGTVLFKKKLSYGTPESACTILTQISDGGYIVGCEFEPTFGNQKACVTKLDASGNHVWTNTYDLSTSLDYITGLCPIASGGAAFCFYSGVGSQQWCNFVKIDASGNVVWSKKLSAAQTNSIIELPNGEFLTSIFNSSNPASGNYTRGSVLKLGATGNLLWGSNMSCRYINSIFQSSDGNYVVSGETPYGIDYWGPGVYGDFYLAKINTSGVNCGSYNYPGTLLGGTTAVSQTCTVVNSSLSLTTISSSGYTVSTLPFTTLSQCLCMPNAGPDKLNARYPCCAVPCTSVGIGLASVPGYTYSWTPTATLSCTTCAQPVATPCSTTEYTMTITTAGCIKHFDTVLVTTLLNIGCDCGGGGGFTSGENERQVQKEQFSVYPSPASHFVNIEIPEDSINRTLTIFDSQGRMVYSSGVASNAGTIISVNTEDWSDGVYMVRLYSDTSHLEDRTLIISH